MHDSPIPQLLDEQPIAVVDGAMATELEKRGVDTSNELWSASALLHQRQAIYDVHMSYLKAGANIAITDTYQANPAAFAAMGIDEDGFRTLIAGAVWAAKRACEDWKGQHPGNPTPLVAGSVGPYGAYLADGSEYTGDYRLTEQQYDDFHRTRMQALAQSGVDLFAFETMPNIGEVQALTNLLRDEFQGMTGWVSFSLSENGDLADGTSLEKAVAIIEGNPQIAAIGVNCVPMDRVLPAIRNIGKATDKPIIIYPNNGDIYDPKTKTWTKGPCSSNTAFTKLVPQWIDAGARLIGGCCRTMPEDIRAIARAVRVQRRETVRE